MQRESGDPADPITAAGRELRTAHDRVRRDLADLGSDTASAPPVPAEVTAAIETALRAAPPPDHRVVAARTGDHRQSRPPLRWRRPAAAAGVLAGVLALGIGVFALAGDRTPAGFVRDPGPSARHITARQAPQTLPLTDPQILDLLQRPADLGTIGDPQGCLVSLGYPTGTSILGAAPVSIGNRRVILLVVPAPKPSSVIAVVVGPDCPTAGTGVLAQTELARP